MPGPLLNLTKAQCSDQAIQCRLLADKIMTEAHRVMLQHIAATWDRIAADIEGRPFGTEI
jgi:hypothetical protein